MLKFVRRLLSPLLAEAECELTQCSLWILQKRVPCLWWHRKNIMGCIWGMQHIIQKLTSTKLKDNQTQCYCSICSVSIQQMQPTHETDRTLTHWHLKLIQGLSWFLPPPPPPPPTTTTTRSKTRRSTSTSTSTSYTWGKIKKTNPPAWEGEMPHGLNHLTRSGGFRAGSLSILGGFNPYRKS